VLLKEGAVSISLVLSSVGSADELASIMVWREGRKKRRAFSAPSAVVALNALTSLLPEASMGDRTDVLPICDGELRGEDSDAGDHALQICQEQTSPAASIEAAASVERNRAGV
jgi:hypothetical protein